MTSAGPATGAGCAARPTLMKSFFHRIVGGWHSPPIMLKMISFAVIGLGNTVIDLGVFAFVYETAGARLVPTISARNCAS